MRKLSSVFFAALLTVVLSSAALAQTNFFTYQGNLVLNRQPATGNYDFQFLLFDSLSGGTQIDITNPRPNLTVTNGVFTTELYFQDDQQSTANRYLEIRVRPAGGTDYTTLTPRTWMTSAPTAMKSWYSHQAGTAQNALNLGGQSAEFYRNASNLNAGTISPARLPTPLSLPGPVSGGAVFSATNAGNNNGSAGVRGESTATVGLTYGGIFTNASTSGRAVQGVATATSGTNYGGFFQTDSSSGRGVSGFASSQSGTTYGVVGESVSSAGRGVTGFASSGTGTTYGGFFQSISPNGRGVYGLNSATSGTNYGGYFETASFNGRGVFGESTSTGDGSGIGGLFVSRNNSGKGVEGQATATTGTNYGGYFTNDGTGGAAVYGRSDATSGTSFGGRFQAAGTGSIGTYAIATSATGTTYGGYFRSNSSSGVGVLGLAANGSGTTYGVWGQSDSGVAANAWGVWAQGRLGASGTKSFRIDHPTDPENKYLLHYSIESPEVLNSYTGKILLDENGEATVTLPSYFASINKNPRYSLTAIGAAMPLLHIAEEIDESLLTAGTNAKPGENVPTVTFRISGGVAGAKVSWEVKAIRNDPWMRRAEAPVESEKTGDEKGKYLHPELFGQPKEKAITYQKELADEGKRDGGNDRKQQ